LPEGPRLTTENKEASDDVAQTMSDRDEQSAYVDGFAGLGQRNQDHCAGGVETMVDGVVAVHHFPFAFAGFNASVVSQQVRLYADPGSLITQRGRNFTSGDFTTNATISGSLIPAP
jgi:hypothetical protein